MRANTTLAFALGLGIALAGCHCPQDRPSSNRRGSADAGASSFAFFGGLKAFFVDEPPGVTRPVEAADLTRVDDTTAPVDSTAPAAGVTSPGIR